MPCRDCFHYLSSENANKPRAGLEGFGYCNAAPTVELRARFFHETRDCWLEIKRFQVRRIEVAT